MAHGAGVRVSLAAAAREGTKIRRRPIALIGLCVIAVTVGALVPTAGSALAGPAEGRASAASTSTSTRFYMEPIDYRTTLCTGETATYTLAVFAQSSAGRADVMGVNVEAYPNDSKLGAFTHPSAHTGGWEGEPVAAQFRFRAGKKPGRTTLVFQGAVKGVAIQTGYVSFNIPIRVIDCKFKVSGTLQFPPDQRFPTIEAPPLVVRVLPTNLTVDVDGHLSGSATVHWVSATVEKKIAGGICSVTETFGADDAVVINGEVSDDRVLTLTFEFPAANGLLSISCDGETVPSQGFPYLVATLRVQIRTSGGVVKSTTNIKDFNNFGKAVIVVKKVAPK